MPDSKAKPNPPSQPQADKFRDLARQLECDEDEKAFEEKVRRVSRQLPSKEPGDGKA